MTRRRKILRNGYAHVSASWRIVLTRRQSRTLVSSRDVFTDAGLGDEFTLTRAILPRVKNHFPFLKRRNGRFHRPRYIGFKLSLSLSLVPNRFNSTSNLRGVIESALEYSFPPSSSFNPFSHPGRLVIISQNRGSCRFIPRSASIPPSSHSCPCFLNFALSFEAGCPRCILSLWRTF